MDPADAGGRAPRRQEPALLQGLGGLQGDRGGFHSTTYVAQENIQVETLKPGVDTDCHQINHPETGKYFDVYRVTGSGPHHQHYKANEVVASQYPEDYAIDEDAE